MTDANLTQQVSRSVSDHSVQRAWVKTLLRAVLFGAASISLYLLVFLNQDTITEYFSKGGFYAIVVVVTALVFSLVHGTFANYVLELIGIRAKDNH